MFERDGAIFANSRDVAAFFEKDHFHVLRDVDNLIDEMGAQNCAALFISQLAFDPAANRETRSFDITRDGFTLLAMGFIGLKALANGERPILDRPPTCPGATLTQAEWRAPNFGESSYPATSITC